MKFQFLIASVFIVGLLFFSSATSDAQPEADPAAVFPVELLIVQTSAGEFEFTVEIADDNAERQRGLMFRKNMLPTHGMLFQFDTIEVVHMWMANTVLPLDMIFVRDNGSVAKIEQNTTPFSRRAISSREPVAYVLELNAGVTQKIGLRPGDRLIHRFFSNVESTAE